MKKTKAPLILFGFLGVLVCFIIASIVISLKNPVKDDTSYFSSKKEIDYKINTLLREQKWFLKHRKLFLQVDSGQKLPLIPPFSNSTSREAFKLGESQKHTFALVINGNPPPKDFRAHLFLERINSDEERWDLGEFSPGLLSGPFSIAHKGRYKAIVVVEYMREGEPKKVFFEREIFVF